MHRICHKNIIFGIYTEYRYRNNAQMVRTGQYGGSERWQGTVIIEMAINMANADYPSFFLWNKLEPRCQQRAAGSLELPRRGRLACWVPSCRGPHNAYKLAKLSFLGAVTGTTRLLNQRWTSLLTSESIAWQENPSNKWQQPIQQSHQSINNQIHISKI